MGHAAGDDCYCNARTFPACKTVQRLGGCRTTMYRSLYWRRLNQAAGAAAECAPHISSLPAASCALCSRPSVDDVRLQHVDYYQIQMRENQSTNRHMHRQNREVDVIGTCERSVPTH